MIAHDSDIRPHDEAASPSILPPETLFVLRPVGDADGMASVALAAGRHVIGSSAACDIRLDVTGVEPRHCLIVTGPNRAVVRAYEPDTLLNGAAVTESPLAIGDVLSVGPVELRLDAADESVGAVLRDVQSHFGLREEPELRLKRWRDDLLRRENDLAIAVAVLRNGKRPADSDNPDERFAHVNRLRRRVSEMTAEISAAQTDILARERALHERSEHLEGWLASAATAEAKCRQDQQHIAEERARLDAAQQQHHKRTAELDSRAASLDARQTELERMVADIAAREQAIVEDANTCKAARAQLAVDRAAITTQQEALRAERDRLAKERTELSDERELLRLEVADLAKHREEANAQIEIALEELQHMEAMQRSDEDVKATAESQRAAEIELAWRERDFELREMELTWQRNELNDKSAELARLEAERARDQIGFQEWQSTSMAERAIELTRREQELDRLLTILTEENASRSRPCVAEMTNYEALGEPGRELAEWQARLTKEQQSICAVTEALAAERAALRAEEARFNAARREFALEQERFADAVRADLARRDAEAAKAVAESEVEAIVAPEPASDESECVVDVAQRVTHSEAGAASQDATESLREFENALATLFDSANDPSLQTDIIAADSNAGFWTPLEAEAAPIKVGGFELDDASNPNSVARYMEELLQRVREDNPLVPPPPDQEGQDASEGTRTASAVLYEPFQLPIPRQSLDKQQLRAQTESLRGVANLSARSAIKKHSRRLRKAELFAKGVLSAIAIVIGGFLMAVYARFGSAYLWHLVAGFATVIFVMYDFLVSFQRFSEASKPVEMPEGSEDAAETCMPASTASVPLVFKRVTEPQRASATAAAVEASPAIEAESVTEPELPAAVSMAAAVEDSAVVEASESAESAPAVATARNEAAVATAEAVADQPVVSSETSNSVRGFLEFSAHAGTSDNATLETNDHEVSTTEEQGQA